MHSIPKIFLRLTTLGFLFDSQIRPLLDKLEERVCDGAGTSDDALPSTFKPYKNFAEDASKLLALSATYIDGAVQELGVQVIPSRRSEAGEGGLTRGGSSWR